MGDVEERLVQRLRELDLAATHPGLRERSWREFCAMTGIVPERDELAEVPSPVALPTPAPAVPAAEAAPGEKAHRLRFSRHPVSSPLPSFGR